MDKLKLIKMKGNNMLRGIVRELDDLGRVTIPKEMRQSLGFRRNEPVDIYVENGIICINPARVQCVCCGSKKEDKLRKVKGVLICTDCINQASNEQ